MSFQLKSFVFTFAIFAVLFGAVGCASKRQKMTGKTSKTTFQIVDAIGIQAWKFIQKHSSTTVFTRVSFGRANDLHDEHSLPEFTAFVCGHISYRGEGIFVENEAVVVFFNAEGVALMPLYDNSARHFCLP